MKKFMYCLLAAVFLQIVGSVLAFQHLAWWQAILVSLFLFMALFRLMVWLAKLLFVRFLKRTEDEVRAMANPHLLKDAQVIVHSIEPAALPEQFAYYLANPELSEVERREQAAEYANLAWHAVEVTVVPHAPTGTEANRRWQPHGLSLIPYESQPPQHSMVDMFSGRVKPEGDDQCVESYQLHELRIQHGKDWLDPAHLPEDYAMEGPQRLRFVVGVPREQDVVKFAYHHVTLGRLELHVPASRGLLSE